MTSLSFLKGRQRCLSSPPEANGLISTDIKSMQETARVFDSVVYIPAFIFLFFLGIYILTSSGSIHGTIDGTVRYAVTKSIVDSNSVSIPEDLGRDNGIIGSNGKYYSWYGIGQSALMIPLYVISKALPNPEFVVSLFNPLISAITCVVLFLFCVRLGYSNRTSVVVTLMYGLGTIAWPQSKGPFEHPLETILILLSIFLIHLHVRNKSYLKLVMSAVFLGIAFITRAPSLLTLPPILLYLLFSRIPPHRRRTFSRKKTLMSFFKEAIIYGMTLVPFGVFYLYYNYVRFGDVFESGYSKIFNQWGVEPFGTPLHIGLYGLMLSPGKGFFLYSPIAVLFIFAIRNFYKKNKGLTIAFLTLITASVLFHSKYTVWHGDWAWGPRYLTVLTPFLMIPLGELFENGSIRKSLCIKVAVMLLFTVSILVQLSAVTVNLNKYFIKNQIPARNIPNHIYFEPRYLPIKEQFKFVVEIAKKIRYYTPPEIRPDTNDTKAINEQITINVPDFWYVYYIYAGAPKGQLAGMVILLLVLTAISFVMILEKGLGDGEQYIPITKSQSITNY